LVVVQDWCKRVIAEGGKDVDGMPIGLGLTANYDSTFDCECTAGAACGSDNSLPRVGRLIVWADGIPSCRGDLPESVVNSLMKAVYIVNGGTCSPVLSFNPTVKWHFQIAAKAGGSSWQVTGNQQKTQEGTEKLCLISGRGSVDGRTVPTQNSEECARGAQDYTNRAGVVNNKANLGFHAIEAELRVQGDPSLLYCSPIAGYGRTVGIIFINPYSITDSPGNPCPSWSTVTSSVCNDILTNKMWFIKGVDHQIKEGSYITSIKLLLPAPGAELDAAGSEVHLGGWSEGALMDQGGLFACTDKYVEGNESVQVTIIPDCVDGNQYVGGGTQCETSYT
jgi:hypothetical protein